MHWAGEPSGRVGRGGGLVSASETRWIVPVKPYTRRRNTVEFAEHIILMCVTIAAIIFGFTIIIWSVMA